MVINRFTIDLVERDIKVFFYTSNNTHYLKGKKPTTLYEDLKDDKNAKEIIDWIKNLKKEKIKDEQYIYFSFYENNGTDKKATISTTNNKFKKHFIRETLIRMFLDKGLFVEPYKEGCDFCIYKKSDKENGFDKYIRFDFVIHCYFDKSLKRQVNELSISIGSDDTYFHPLNKNEVTDSHKVILDNLLLRYKEVSSNFNNSYDEIIVKADFAIRKELGILPKPHFQFYRKNFDSIDKFVKESFSSFNNELLKICIPFKKLDDSKIKNVSFEYNKMIFGNDQTDYSTINGMRDYGPFKKPDNIEQTKLLFIYPDSDSANKLYVYFSKGYRHFPGLESYVGIPAQPAETKIKYEHNKFIELPEKIELELSNSSYENLIAICIMPFNKQSATPEQSDAYYKIKEILLNKNIPSQFLERSKIYSENFHYYLPNISIAMLAKLGGVPWKLQTDRYDQLIIGFNIFRNEANSFIGSAIYFDNEGLLKDIYAFEKKNSVKEITLSVRDSIVKYIEQNQSCNSMVVHYFKPPSDEERISIEKMLSTELKLKIPVVFVEVNDAKTSTDICFDMDFDLFMPQSGTYVELKPNEYLLFNNLRYWEKPVNPVRQEEYPIKIKIYDPNGVFPHDKLVSQLYEFSRLYWKGLKQKPQPVTTLYSKLIAEYVAHFKGDQIPDNNTAKHTIWFV